MRRFEGKTCVVTGAGGDLGAAIALRFAQEGANLALCDLEDERLEATARSAAVLGGAVVREAFDQADRDAVDAAVADLCEQLGRVDVLVANAGYGRIAPFLEVSQRQWQRHLDINLTGTFNVCQAVARRLADQREGGSIVVNASSAALVAADHFSAYCATKAAVRMLALSMASELGGHGIRVNTVMPGVIRTQMTAPLLEPEGTAEGLIADTPAGRLGEPGDVAALVAFLASDEAGYITGESVFVDGGQAIHGGPRWFHTDYRKPNEVTWEGVAWTIR
jgi:NAD(P)-dependent dehydrogenase (short-subunit alcohol dehydrogenase family)